MDAVHPSLTYPSLAAKMLDMDVINMGVGGGTFYADDVDYTGYEPDLITVSFDTNDWGWVKDEMELQGNMRAYLERMTEVYACHMLRYNR